MKTYGRAAGQLYRDVAMIKDMINVEYKSVTTNIDEQPMDSDGAILTGLGRIAEGDGPGDRDGDTVKLKSFAFKGAVTTAPTVSGVSRVIFFVDKQNQMTSASDIVGISATDTLAPYGFQNRANYGKWIILYDHLFKHYANEAETNVEPFQFKKKIDLHQRYSGSAGSTITMNDIKAVVISDQASASTALVLRGVCKLRYVDN